MPTGISLEVQKTICSSLSAGARCSQQTLPQTMGKRSRPPRGDKNGQAANHRFEQWWKTESAIMNKGSICWTRADSELRDHMQQRPVTLMYFLLNVLQRLTDDFWQTDAGQNAYVIFCVKCMSKCPPSVIALLLLMKGHYGFAATQPPLPKTDKDRIFWSEMSRAEAEAKKSASGPARASATTLEEEIAYDAFWHQFDVNVYQHVVLPAVEAGVITCAPNADKDNPSWWTDKVKPLFDDSKIYSLHWKGGKKRAQHSWKYICAQLKDYVFPERAPSPEFCYPTVVSFLVATGYCKLKGQQQREEKEAKALVVTEGGYATASAAATTAGDARVASAFWELFAEDVVKNLVWPAVHRGHITAAPNAASPRPTWWTKCILPILQHRDVVLLHWKGSEDVVKRCWRYACQELSNNVSWEHEALTEWEPMPVEEFLHVAGYRMEAAAASSSSTQQRQVSAPAKPLKVTVDQQQVAKRFAYSTLDQTAREKVQAQDWMFIRTVQDSVDIKLAFDSYLRNNALPHQPLLCANAVVTELRLVMQEFSQQKLWPRFLTKPRDSDLKKMPTTDEGYVDTGNEIWEMMVVLVGLPSAMETLAAQQTFNAAPNAPYGHKTNKSGRGNYNFRGNVLEQLFEHLAREKELEQEWQP